jgi:hypothetical protein
MKTEKEKDQQKIIDELYKYQNSAEYTDKLIYKAMDKWANYKVKNLNISAVINRRELLIAFIEWYNHNKAKQKKLNPLDVDEYIKAINSL